jgi:hypothetical protein
MCLHPSDSVIDEMRERHIERAEIPNIKKYLLHIFPKTGNNLP